MVCKYFWKLDTNGILRVKFQVCSTFGLFDLIGGKKLGESSYLLLPPHESKEHKKANEEMKNRINAELSNS